jgi:catechol 2,3-dioxygenase-like lactoylglutathione lyase family enzyme
MNRQSAVEFATPTRVHVGIGVRDLERSIAFYRHLFAQEPTKLRPRYAKFEVADPPVNLTLNEGRSEDVKSSAASHFGVQVKSTDAVLEMAERLRAAGLAPEMEEATTCCYAVQDKAWVTDPDSNAWEIFVVLDADAPAYKANGATTCCTGDKQEQHHTASATSCCS